MPDVDLDAAHAAREEAVNGTGPAVKIGGKRFRLKVSPPVVLGDSYVALFTKESGVAEVRTFLRHALAQPSDVDKVLDAGFQFGDATPLLDAWKVTEGESSASARSSAKGGTRSRPTSSRSTASTSRKPSGRKA